MTNNNGPAPTFGITEAQIDELAVKSAAEGDWLQVVICDLARGVPVASTWARISKVSAAKLGRTLRAYGYDIRFGFVCTADIVRAWASCAATIRDVATLE